VTILTIATMGKNWNLGWRSDSSAPPRPPTIQEPLIASISIAGHSAPRLP
jgi:hypothetical protein